MRQRSSRARLAPYALSALSLCALLACCGRGGADAAAVHGKSTVAERRVTIGFSIDTLALERWQRDLDVFMNKAKELGSDVIVQNAGNSVEEQNKQLLYLLGRKVDVAVVVAKKRDSLTDSIKTLRSKGVEVISYDRLINDADISLYISVNTEQVGELMARQFLASGVGSRWHLILGPVEDYNMTLIQHGIRNAIRGRNVTITGTFYTDGWNYDLSYNEAASLITGGSVPDAIVCGNDAVAGSVIKALEDYYPDRHIPVCGQDADIAACQHIVRGRQDFTVYKPITLLAERAAEYAVKMAQGMAVADMVSPSQTINNGYADIPVVWLEPQVVTKENIDEVVIKSGFHTYGEVYR